jgi:hypothetical protein
MSAFLEAVILVSACDLLRPVLCQQLSKVATISEVKKSKKR